MSEFIHLIEISGDGIEIHFPKICSFCNASLPDHIEILSKGYTRNAKGAVIEHGIYFLLFKCPYCENLILRLFDVRKERETGRFRRIGILKKQYKKTKNVTFPESIKAISPRFISVYSQSFHSEQQGLDELSGMGYRKALEILVKDYAICKFPNDSESIAKKSFQDALSRIDTHEIKVLGQVATKIGNDETHYYRKHDWKVSELKNYIESIIFFITSDLDFDQADVRLSQDRGQKQ